MLYLVKMESIEIKILILKILFCTWSCFAEFSQAPSDCRISLLLPNQDNFNIRHLLLYQAADNKHLRRWPFYFPETHNVRHISYSTGDKARNFVDRIDDFGNSTGLSFLGEPLCLLFYVDRQNVTPKCESALG